jgi:hypothetical protein
MSPRPGILARRRSSLVRSCAICIDDLIQHLYRWYDAILVVSRHFRNKMFGNLYGLAAGWADALRKQRSYTLTFAPETS